MLCGHEFEGPLENLDLVRIDRPDTRGPPAIVGQGGAHEAFGIPELLGPVGGAEERLSEGRVSHVPLRRAQSDGEVDPHQRIGIGDLRIKGERRREVAHGVGRCQGGEGGITRLARVADGPGQVDGLRGVDPVPGQLADAGTRSRSPQSSSRASATLRMGPVRRVGPRSS